MFCFLPVLARLIFCCVFLTQHIRAVEYSLCRGTEIAGMDNACAAVVIKKAQTCFEEEVAKIEDIWKKDETTHKGLGDAYLSLARTSVHIPWYAFAHYAWEKQLARFKNLHEGDQLDRGLF